MAIDPVAMDALLARFEAARTSVTPVAIDPTAMDALLARFEAARASVTASPSRLSATAAAGLTAGSAAAKNVDFASVLRKSIDQVDQMQTSAGKLADRFQLEDPGVTLEETMVALQKANVSFQAALQIRNKIVAAYHDIMNIQV